MCSRVHPNLVGHTYIADLVIGWMQDRMVSMLAKQWLGGGARLPDAVGVARRRVHAHAAHVSWLYRPMLAVQDVRSLKSAVT